MVDRFFRLFHREFNGLHEAALLLGLSAIFSQFLALARDRLLASSFGAGSALDIYYAAFRIPDILYVSLASLVSVTVVLPFIVKHLEDEDQAAATRLMFDLFSRFLSFISIAALIAFSLMPRLALLVAPGFSPAALAELVLLSRIMLLSPILLGLSNLVSNITQASRKFFLFALSPIFYNLGIIVGILFLYPEFGPAGLAWGVILGATGHLMIQLPAIISGPISWASVLKPKVRSGEWKKIFLLSWPRTLTLSANQLTIFVLVALASSLAAGSIALFNFAYNLQSVILSVIGVSYSVAAFPSLARCLSNGEKSKFIEQMSFAVRNIVFWSLPAIGLFIVLRAHIVRVVLGAGRFDWSNTRLTAAALVIFLFSVVAQSLILLFVRGYYAGGHTTKPLIINVFSSILTIGLAFTFLNLVKVDPTLINGLAQLLRVGDVPGIKFLVLPLAFSVGAIVNLIILWRFFQSDFGLFPKEVYRGAWQSALSAIVAAGVTYLGLALLAPFFDQATFLGIFLQGLSAGLFGIFTHIFLLKKLGNTELVLIGRAVRHKLWHRFHPVIPETESL